MNRLILLPALLLPVLGASQIRPDHAYNGVGRPLLMDIRMPRARRGAEIQLLQAVSGEVWAKASVTGGRVDLVKLFPDLWKAKYTKVLYAQLVVDDRKVGPAVVLQPMLNPPISRLATDGKTVEFVPDEDGPMYDGIRAYVDQDILFETSLGNMRFRMRPDAAPNTVWNLMSLVRDGLYTNTIFHRVVAKTSKGDPFVIQGGDPTGTGSGGAGWAYPLENSPLPHDFGVISIARSTDPNTNGCQIFVALSRAGTSRLDGKYASFGQIIEGKETILKIAAVPVGKEDRPTTPPVIFRARLVDAKPYGE